MEFEGEPSPDFPGIGANAVDHAPPVSAARHGVLGEPPQPAPKRDEARAEWNALPLERQGRDRPVRLRQEPAPRHGVDRAAMPARPERDDKVHHGQPGAADQHGRIRIDAGIARALPWIDVAGGACLRRLFMTGGEDRKIAGDASAVIDADCDAGRRRSDAAPFAIDDPQPPRLSGRAEMRRDQLGDVAAVDATLREGQRPRLLTVSVIVVLGEPSAEMQGVVGKGAHIGGAHVQQMPGLRRRVGHAAADHRPLLDQRHADIVVVVAQEMAGEQHAARSAADDDDVLAVFCRQRDLNISPSGFADQSPRLPRSADRRCSAATKASTSSGVL